MMKKEVIAKHMKAGRPVQWLPEINQFVVFRKPIDLVKDAVKVGDGTVRIDIGSKGKSRKCVACNKGFDDGVEVSLFAYTDIAENQHFDVGCSDCLSPKGERQYGEYLIPYDSRKEEE